MHDYSVFSSHTLKLKGWVITMNDSAQDLEQLIRQYTQELLRFQKQYAAHMPATPTPPEEEPAPLNITEETTEDSSPAGDRPLLLADEEERYPRSPMPDGLNAAEPEEPLPPERSEEEIEPEMVFDLPSLMEEDDPFEDFWSGRDLMSDPAAETPQAFPPAAPPAVPAPDMTDFGRLQVQVFKAREAIPIENATVTIFSREEGELTPLTVTTTNRSGFTPAITLPTVSASLSLEPGNAHPYTTYIVQVNAPGYFTVQDVEVPVYSGITSVQPAEMLPLPENYQGDTTVTYPESAPNL